MKLNPREKLMLGLLLAAGILFLSYNYVISPQLVRIEDLTLELLTKESEAARIQTELASIDRIQQDIQDLTAKIHEKTEPFYPKILQRRIILLLDEVFEDAEVFADSMGFSTIETREGEDTGGPMLERMSVTFPFRAEYAKVVAFLAALEDMERVIIINSLQMAVAEGDLLSGGMNVEFYGIAKPAPQPRDSEYLSWPYTGDYGRFNPFREIIVEAPTGPEEPADQTEETDEG